MREKTLSGVILAGGESKRMGQDKAFMLWRGKALYEWALAALKPLCNEVFISSNSDPELFGGQNVIADRFPGIGPIAGLESGLFHAANSSVIFVSCDTPLISSDLFAYLLEKHTGYDISLAAHNGINEPMIGIYNKSVHEVFLKAIRSGLHKPPAVIRSAHWQDVNIFSNLNFFSPDLFLNLNRPEDLTK
ncbi:MAG: molybdenum cofactor guanylyltransferase [Bacteroidetes bacterium]|jgi:molybdenum cofactor guanylyltransferase|nr:molybdenum cofactor guanylyltransferase [Bacteroidota bacterium]MBT3747687.1 molybdenum cofactor guanylyltransferase [Bacteroidota bacterium]MBT4398391.1 molybdenum cofactor guanylyltransferase [Bacteroidota bacterium]MBT4411813.1 molybdenum cofactor guanylyltransferase [Bacteroidota bacterium]MBT5427509.1 molybdenum cofactor guanylyltransferase [Bacteroidota bacterium]